MSRGRELIKNTGILLIAKISSQFVSFLLLPLYTTLLTTSEYGEIDIYTSLVMIILPFLTLQLEMGLFRYFITEKSEENRSKIISTTFVIVIVVLLIASILYFFFGIMFQLKFLSYLYFYYLSMAIATVLTQVCRAVGDNKSYGISSFISSTLTIGLNVILIAGLHWKVEGILASSIIAQFISVVYIIQKTKVFRYLRISSFDKCSAKTLLQYSVPLIFNQVASWTVNYSDRLIILSVWGASSNGIYSLANKFSNIMSSFFNIFNIAWTENVVRSMSDMDSASYINKIFQIIFNIYFAIITGIINLLPFFFSLLVNGDYADAYGHVPILLLAMFFSGMAATIGSVYVAYEKTKEVSITTIMAGVCNIMVHFGLLHVCGLYAASISTLISFGLLFIYRFVFLKRFFKLEFSVLKTIPQVAILIYSWFAYINKNPYLIICGLLMNLSFCGILMRKNKDVVLNLVKRR